MAVTINEIEVLNEPSTAAMPPPAAVTSDEDQRLPTPEELARLLRYELMRELRVWAH